MDGSAGHVVEMTKSGWILTVCGTFMPGDIVETRPARVCGKCRARMVEQSPKVLQEQT